MSGYNETCITCNDNIIEFLEGLMGVRKLVRSDGIAVNIDTLHGKIVGLFFMSLTAAENKHEIRNCILDLATAYHVLSKSKKGQFEIVWIAKVESEFQFDEYLKMMPWLAIPYTYSVVSNRLCDFAKIEGPNKYDMWLFNPHGELLKKNAHVCFRKYGVDWYPFTETRIREIDAEDEAVGAYDPRYQSLTKPTRHDIRKCNRKLVQLSVREDRVVGTVGQKLVEPTAGGSAGFDVVEFLECLMGVRKLVRSDGIMVNTDTLRGKIVGLFFMSLIAVVNNSFIMNFILDLANTYDELSKSQQGKFEIVWIAQAESESQFDEYLKMMPWLAIPYTYSVVSNRLCDFSKMKGVNKYDIWLFNRRGELFKKKADYNFREYGADWYPFTERRLKEIEAADEAIGANKTLRALLTNPTRDFVIRNSDGSQVPISWFQDKVVGIYLCDDYHNPSMDPVGLKLVEVYGQLKQRGKPFEVVMVNTSGLYGDEQPMPDMESLPWYSLPRYDSNCKRLERIFDSDEFANRLVIVGPYGSFVNKFGYATIAKYGMEAYPLSRLAVVRMEKRKLEELSLKSVLTFEDNNYVIRMNGEQIPVSNVLGKTTVVLFTDFGCGREGLVEKLKKWHADITKKWHADITEEQIDFEVILVAAGYDDRSFSETYGEMPWFALPYNDVGIRKLLAGLKICGSRLAVFGRNGMLLTMMHEFDFNEIVTDGGNFGYKSLNIYVRQELNRRHWWPSLYDDDRYNSDQITTLF